MTFLGFGPPAFRSVKRVEQALAGKRLYGAFLTPTRLSKLTKVQYDFILELAVRVRQAAGFDVLVVRLPRLAHLQNIVNWFLDSNIGVKQISDKMIARFIQAAVESMSKTFFLERIHAVAMANSLELFPASPD